MREPVTIKYVLHSGTVRSAADRDIHFIPAHRLPHLYQVHPRECIDTTELYKFTGDVSKLIHLYPRSDGDYRVPVSAGVEPIDVATLRDAHEALRTASEYTTTAEWLVGKLFDKIEADAHELTFAKRDGIRWKNNHDHQVMMARMLKERPDLPIERVRAYNLMVEQQQLFDQIGNIVHGENVSGDRIAEIANLLEAFKCSTSKP